MSKDEAKSEKAKNPRDSTDGGVAEYLVAPKKKQKSYVIIAMAQNVSQDKRDAVARYIEGLGKGYVLVQPKTPDELARQISRQVHLMILDDTFAPRDRLLKLVKFMKEKKAADGLPVLFLTREPKEMTAAYRENLVAHQENDDYVDMKGQSPLDLVARIKQALEFRNRRRSRRFKIGMPVSFQVLGSEDWRKGTLVDISLHGAMLASKDSDIPFDLKSQVRLQIPVDDIFPPEEGEIFRLSCRVRRLSITGVSAGMSFEHVTERQLTLLTVFVTALAGAQSTGNDIDNSSVKSV